MPESTLSLTLSELEQLAGSEFGYGRGKDGGEQTWSAVQQADITEAVEDGLRDFYFPAPIQGIKYEWTFLRPVGRFTLADGEAVVPLPDDFGGPEGNVTVSTASEDAFLPVEFRNEEFVRAKHSEFPSTTGRPQVVSIQVLADLTPARSNRHQLYVWPTADKDYTLKLQYYLLPSYLTTINPYPYGGAIHAETLKAAILAAVERKLQDTPGKYALRFQQRLSASVALDKRFKPRDLGINVDHSDGTEYLSRLGRRSGQTWTVTTE